MKEIIKKVLKEEIIKEANITTVSENSFFNGVLNLMDNPPYLPLLYSMELSKEDIVKVFELMYRNLGEERTKVAFSEDGSISVIDPVFHNPLYYEEPHLRFKDTIYWEKWDYWPGTNEWKRYVDMNGDRRFRSKNGIQSYGKDIEPEDMEDGFYPPLSTDINEGIGNSQIKKRMNTLFLDKVLKELVRDTKLDHLGLHLPFHYGSLYITSKKEISKLLTHKEYDYRESFYGYVMDLYSLSIEESVYCYPKYVQLVIDKFNKLSNLTEETTQSNSNSGEWYYQYVYDSKYLNGVLEQLLNETRMEWDTDTGNVIVKVDWNPSNPSILYQSSYGTFKKHCQEVYSLKNEEVSDMYTLYIMEIKEIIREKEEGGSKLTLESVSPKVSENITHKGKLNFIDRITDMMMDETYVTDIECTQRNTDWCVEGMRRIYFYKGDNSLGRDDSQGIIQIGESWVKFVNKYNRELFDATFKHLKRLGAGNMSMDMEVAVWTEYLYKLRDKYFGGGDDPLLY